MNRISNMYHITSWHKAHPVVEEVRVVDGETTWDYFSDIWDKSETAKVNAAYGLDQIRVTDNDETGEVFVKHAKQDNGDHILEIPLMSAAER